MNIVRAAALVVPAAGVAEPSTLVIVVHDDGRRTHLLNSRANADPRPTAMQLPDPILPGYHSYVLDDKALAQRAAAIVPGALAIEFALLDAVEALRRTTIACRRFVVAGSAAAVNADHPQWQQLADVLGERIRIRTVEDAATRGQAILNAIADAPAASIIIKSMALYHEQLVRPNRQRHRDLTAQRLQ